MTITVDVNNPVGRLTFAAFAGTVLIGGSNFVAVKFSNLELAPLYGAAVRFTAAAVIFALLANVLSLRHMAERCLVASSTAYSLWRLVRVALRFAARGQCWNGGGHHGGSAAVYVAPCGRPRPGTADATRHHRRIARHRWNRRAEPAVFKW
jgi:hypothetical protein